MVSLERTGPTVGRFEVIGARATIEKQISPGLLTFLRPYQKALILNLTQSVSNASGFNDFALLGTYVVYGCSVA